jgi:hypothetical protein
MTGFAWLKSDAVDLNGRTLSNNYILFKVSRNELLFDLYIRQKYWYNFYTIKLQKI